MLEEKDILQCKCCGNRDYSSFIKRDNGRLCKCCGVWYQEQASHEDMMMQVRCENGYAQLRTYRFDDARDTFETVLMEDAENISALWGVLLARFGVVFIKGFYKNVVEPIYCFQNYDRMRNRYVQSEREYIKLMQLLENDNELRYDYESKAKKIDDAIDDFKKYKEETDRDVFICVKISAATHNNPELKGNTEDYGFAMKLYEDLEERGVNAFFSYVTLKNDVDSDEKIWRNLVKSKKMLLIASSEEYLESPWVKSEWKRWLFLKREKELYIYVLNRANETPYDILPNEFSNNQIYTSDTYKKLLKDICEGLDISPAGAARKKREKEEFNKREDELIKNEETHADKKNKTAKKTIKPLIAVIASIFCIAAASGAFLVMSANSAPSGPHITSEITTVPAVNLDPSLILHNGVKYEIISETECKVIGIEASTTGSIQIAQNVEGYDVVEIGDRAFYQCNTLTAVHIPNTVNAIGNEAFSKCTNLINVQISDGVTSIGGYAFSDCSALTKVVMPSGLTSIGDGAFSKCTKLASVQIPDSVTSMGNYTFSGCSALTKIVMSSGLTSIGNETFSECTKLANAEIPKSVKTIGASAFKNCFALPEISIPEGATEIGSWAFVNCSAATTLVLPASLETIGGGAFENCSNIKSVEIPSGLTRLENSLFSGCINLKTVVLPGGLLGIEQYAFSGCKNLTAIEIPDSVTSIGNNAFSKCISLASIKIPSGVRKIEKNTFFECTKLASVTFEEGLNAIGKNAFSGCSLLYEAKLPETLTIIENGAFKECTSMEMLSFPSGLIKIGENAFENCNSLVYLEIPGNVKNIPSYVFSYCDNLEKAVFKEGVVSIGASIFYSSLSSPSALKTVELPNSLKTLGASVFYGCRNLTTITYNGSVAEWDAIEKSSGWNEFEWENSFTPDYTICCTDGTIDKNGVVTYY